MGGRALSKVQYGKETTSGTAVAATKILANAEIKGLVSDRKPKYIEDAIAARAKSMRSEVYSLLAEDTISLHDAYFQQLAMIMSMGVKGGVTASEVTASQADYLWAFGPSMTDDNAPNAFTLEFGDDDQAYEVEYCLAKSIKISGEVPQEAGDAGVNIEVEFFGRQVTKTTFTGSLALPTMTTMNAKLARLYKDTAWSGKGGTELANVLRAFEIEIITGLHPKLMGSANKYFNTHGQSWFEVMLTLTLESGAAATAIYDDFQAQTARAWSLAILGPTIGSGTPHSLKVDVWGTPELVTPLDSESNGNNLHQVLIHGQYDPTGATILDVNVTTNSNAL